MAMDHPDKPILDRQAIHVDPQVVMKQTMAKSPRVGSISAQSSAVLPSSMHCC